MPTPSGLPQRGDLLRDSEGVVWRVVQRKGTGGDYSLILRPLSDLSPMQQQRLRQAHLYGDPEGTMRLLEAGWHIGHGWSFIDRARLATALTLAMADDDERFCRAACAALGRRYDVDRQVPDMGWEDEARYWRDELLAHVQTQRALR